MLYLSRNVRFCHISHMRKDVFKHKLTGTQLSQRSYFWHAHLFTPICLHEWVVNALASLSACAAVSRHLRLIDNDIQIPMSLPIFTQSTGTQCGQRSRVCHAPLSTPILLHEQAVKALARLYACAAASWHWRLINNKISIQTSHELAQSLNKSAMLVYIEQLYHCAIFVQAREILVHIASA